MAFVGARIAVRLALRIEEATFMVLLLIGLILFFSIHLVPTAPDMRSGLRDRFGETGYKGLFTVISLIGLSLIVYGYAKLSGGAMPGKNPQIWYPPAWTRHAALTLMLPAMILLVAAYVPSRIRTAVAHPMLAAIKLWALAHLLIRGDLASMILFGSFLAWAVFDRISVARREALGPLGARSGGLVGDLVVVTVGIAAYVLMLAGGHAWLIGVALVPGWRVL